MRTQNVDEIDTWPVVCQSEPQTEWENPTWNVNLNFLPGANSILEIVQNAYQLLLQFLLNKYNLVYKYDPN